MDQQSVHNILGALFQKSQIYTFYQYLKSPYASQGIVSDLSTQKKYFTFNLQHLLKVSPSLSALKNKNMFTQLLKRQGMELTFRHPRSRDRELDRKRFYTVWNDKLTVQSTKKEIYQVWVEGSIKTFLKCRSFYNSVLKELEEGKTMRWNKQGDEIIIVKQWDEMGELERYIEAAKDHHFQIKKSPQQDSKQLVISHPFIRKVSSMKSWLASYLLKRTRHMQFRRSFTKKMEQMKGIYVREDSEDSVEVKMEDMVEERVQKKSKLQMTIEKVLESIQTEKEEVLKLQLKYLGLKLGQIIIICEQIESFTINYQRFNSSIRSRDA